jgi:hypothetical protein
MLIVHEVAEQKIRARCSTKLWTNGADVFCFLSSLPLLPQPPMVVFGSSCHLSTLNFHWAGSLKDY